MTTALTRLSGSAFELTITVPWLDVKKIYDLVFDELAAQIDIEGFRKGKAPKEVITSKIDKAKVYREVINHLLPESYSKALEEHNLKPVIAPRVQVASAQEDKDWQFIAKSAEKPHVELGKYQEEIKSLNAKDKIWVPGQAKEATKEDEDKKSQKVSQIITKLLEICNIQLADILVESEANRLITQLIEDVRQAGLTYEQYLQSSHQTAESVKEKFHQQSQNALKLEFILESIADDLKVQVSEAQINAIIEKEADPKKKEGLKSQSYLLASILRREKCLDTLSNL